MKQIFKTLLLLSLMIIQEAHGQVTVSNVRTELDTKTRSITVLYDLTAKGKFKYDIYDVKLLLSTDGGTNFKTLKIVSGGVGPEVKLGIDKKIVWQYFKEDRNFVGENTAFKVTAEVNLQARQARLNRLGGPESAAYSLIFPGWGQTKVRDGNRYWIAGLAAYLSVGAGLYFANQANNSLENYRNAESLGDADSFFSDFEQQRQLSNIAYGTAAAIWLTDIAFTVIRGLKNKKRAKQNTRGLAFRMQLEPIAQTPVFGFTWSF